MLSGMRRSSMFSSMFRLDSRRSSLPKAEPVSAENVVYAIVQDEEEDLQVNWEFILVSFMIFVAGIVIGRFTAPSTTSPELLSSCEIPNMTCAAIYKE